LFGTFPRSVRDRYQGYDPEMPEGVKERKPPGRQGRQGRQV